MMKKVLYGVALTLFAGVSVGSLQSCKDDLSDYQTQTSYDLSTLKAEELRLAGLIQDNATEIAGIKRDYATIKYVNDQLIPVNSRLDKLEADVAGALSTLSTQEQKLLDLDNLLKNYLDGTDKLASEKYVDGKIGALNEQLEALKEVAASKSEVEEVWLKIEEVEQTMTQILNLHDADIKEINDQLEVIMTAIDSIISQMDQDVTGILIQGVYSPVFGDFSLPIGVKSNILFNWYGYNTQEKEFKFPNNIKEYSETGDPGFTNINSMGLGPQGANDFVTIPEGVYPAEVSLGKVYVTLNPLGKNFNETPLNVVNSQGETLPFTVTLKNTDKVLTHGYSRAQIDQYIYEGEALLNTEDPADIEKVEFKMNESLKSAMKAALKDPSKRTAVGLLKGLYDQMGGMLPAYALQYGWSTSLDDMDPGFSTKAYSVLSQYDLAVATSRPLSYHFLSDYPGSSKRLPILSPLDNLIDKLLADGDFSIKLDPIKIEKAEIKIGKITITAKVDIDGKAIVITIPSVEVVGEGIAEGTHTESTTVTLKPDAELKDVYGAIEEGLTKALEDVQKDINKWTGSMQDDINSQLNTILKDVEDQVNNMIGSINGQITDMIENLGDKLQPYFDKVNRAFDIYNKIATKVNNFLADPNAYLQVVALYGMNGNYGFLSGNVKQPTTFEKAGGDAFSIYLTSYTGELIVPAYKKFVACTAAYKNGVKDESFKPADVNKSASDLCKVLDGNQISVAVPASGLETGKVYEFIYQAVDYSGYTSTKKFYIEVK